VFEWITDQLGSQGTICGGGRYDGLIEMIGGKATPAVGFAIGLERLLELWTEARNEDLPVEVDCYMVYQSDEARRRAFTLSEQLRDAGLNVLLHAGSASMKSQMKRADQSGASVAVILGEDELKNGTASVKLLRSESEQLQFEQDVLAEALYALLFSDEEDEE
jgi:histidyl-tRNA synthetase